MILRSAIVGGLTFMLLFLAAWYTHAHVDRYNGQPWNKADVQITRAQPLDVHLFDPFQPREYIKIRDRFME